MTVSAETRSRRPLGQGAELGSFASPFVRHLVVLAIAAAAAYVTAGSLADGQPALWAVAGLVLGVVAGALGRRPLGVLLVAAGVAIGLMLHLHLRLDPGAEAVRRLSEHGVTYGALLAAAVVGYLVAVGAYEIVVRSRRNEVGEQRT